VTGGRVNRWEREGERSAKKTPPLENSPCRQKDVPTPNRQMPGSKNAPREPKKKENKKPKQKVGDPTKRLTKNKKKCHIDERRKK